MQEAMIANSYYSVCQHYACSMCYLEMASVLKDYVTLRRKFSCLIIKDISARYKWYLSIYVVVVGNHRLCYS